MSEFYIRQNLLASNARTVVKDRAGKSLFLLVGRWGTRGDVLSLYQMNGEIEASIKQATFAFTLGARFNLYQNFKKVGSLQRIFSVNRDFYYVHKLGWVVIGDIQNHQYAIYHLNQKVMSMTKVPFSSGDFYSLDVADDRNAPLCICIAAVLDYWLLDRTKNEERIKKNLATVCLD